jgi:hypothetical protein
MRYALGAVTHDEARALLPSYAAGVLETDEAVRVRAHLAVGCPDCLHDLFSRPLGLPRPEGSHDAPPPLPRARRGAAWVVAAVLGIGGLGAWAAYERHRPEARPPQAPAAPDPRAPALESQRTKALARLAEAKRALAKARREAWRPWRESVAEPEPEGGAAVLNDRDVPSAGARAPRQEKPAWVIRYDEDEDAVSVHVDDAAVGEVLEEIGRQAGAAIRGELRDARQISVEFEDVPTADALHRLLGKQNFMLVYDDHDRLHAVELLGGAQERTVEASAPRPEPATSPPASLDAMLGMVQRHAPVALWGDLATALRADVMPLRLLIENGLHHEDQSVRAAAMRASVEAFEADPELRAAAVSALAGMEEKKLAEMVQAAAGEHAEEALFYVATRASGDLRIKAANVLERLHGNASGSARAGG